MTSYIFGGTVFKTWPKLIKKLVKNGEMIRDETRESIEEQFTLNLDNVVIDISMPDDRQIPNGYPYNKKYLEEYGKQFLNPINDKGFEYTYGERLRSYPCTDYYDEQHMLGPIDQIQEFIIDRLNKNVATRRAFAITTHCEFDNILDKDDKPCLQIVDFKFNKGLLTLTAYFRSQDIMAYPANVYGLNELLKFVGKETNLDCGKITTVSSSLHSYERDWKDILKVVYPSERAMLEYGVLRRRKNVLLEKYGEVA